MQSNHKHPLIRSRSSHPGPPPTPIVEADQSPTLSPPQRVSEAKKPPIRPEFIFMVGGIGLVVFSQVLRQLNYNQSPWGSILLLVVGAGFFILGIQSLERGLPAWFSHGIARLTAWLGVSFSDFLLLIFSLGLSVIATLAAGFGEKMDRPVLALTAWLAGIALALIGGWTTTKREGRFSWQPFIWALALTLLAIPLRVIDTAHIPITLSGDEASAGLSSLRILRGEVNNPFISGWFSFPSLFFFFQSIGIAILGQTTEALRIPAALIGSLTVGATYLLGRTFFNHRAGLYAALFMLGFHFHLHFSRIGLNNIWDGLWFAICLGALWQAWKTGQRHYFLIAGLALGLSQYFYTSSRILAVLIPLWLVIQLIIDRPRLKQRLPGMLLLFLVAFVVFLPSAWFYLNHPHEFQAPMDRVSILGDWLGREQAITHKPPLQILFTQLLNGFRGYTDTPLRVWYTPGVPLLRAIPAGIFLLGIVLLLLRWKDGRTWMILLWLSGFAISGAFSDSTPAAQRYVAVAPAVVVLIGYAVAEVQDRLLHLLPKGLAAQRVMGIAALVLVIALSIDDARFYFGEYIPKSDFGGDNTMVAQVLANDLRQRPGKWQVLFFGQPRMGYASISTLPYLAPNMVYTDVNEPWGSPNTPQPSESNLVFVFLPNHDADMFAVQKQFPGGRVTTVPTKRGSVLYSLYEVTGVGAAQLSGAS